MKRQSIQRRFLLPGLFLLALALAAPSPGEDLDACRTDTVMPAAPGQADAPAKALPPADSLAAAPVAHSGSQADTIPDRDDTDPAPLRVLRGRVRALRVIIDVLLGLVENGLSRGAWQAPVR
jgi:hypothetical protein